jgi:hypothetical protein
LWPKYNKFNTRCNFFSHRLTLRRLRCLLGPTGLLELFKGSLGSPFDLKKKSKKLKAKHKAVEANVEIGLIGIKM